MSQAVRALRVEDLGTVLGVRAHPDDEVYRSAGVMAAARDASGRVVVATATYGEQCTPDPARWSRNRRRELRRRHGTAMTHRGTPTRHELVASLAVSGVDDHRWLGFADGECALVPAGTGAAAAIAAAGQAVHSGVIFRVQHSTLCTPALPRRETNHPRSVQWEPFPDSPTWPLRSPTRL